MLTKPQRTSQQPSPTAGPTLPDGLRAATQRYAKRVRRLKLNALAWSVGVISLTTLWVLYEWQANGAFESFGHEGNPGQWNPTLWAIAIGVWTLVVGIMALAVYFVRPTDDPAVLRVQRLKFHAAAWVFGMVVLTPLWALIEWQDNGAFERWSNNSQPGDWDPWILVVAAIWALAVVALFFVRLAYERPTDAR